MRNSIRIAAVALAAVSFGSAANAATTATGTATAEVLSTLSVSADEALRFGQIAANTGGTVSVGANGNLGSTGGLVSTGTRAPALFTVSGNAGVAVNYTLPTSASTLTYQGAWNVGTQGPVPTMSLSAFNAQWTAGNTLNATGPGQATFTVGGTLTVGNTQQPGLYSGSFDVSVEYQ